MLTTTDPVADMFARIRNGLLVQQTEISVPHSKFKEEIAKELKNLGFLSAVKVEEEDNLKSMTLSVNHSEQPIHELKKLSKPGRRLYASYQEIPRVKNGRGAVIISTSNGVMSDLQARKEKLGGELIGMVY